MHWEGKGDVFSDGGRESVRLPEPPGPWSIIDKDQGFFNAREANATITVKCPDLDYEKTVSAGYAYMIWRFEQVVYLVK